MIGGFFAIASAFIIRFFRNIIGKRIRAFWEYRADNFFTLSQGYAQRLPNGNTLITESEQGHTFEITFEKKIVWEYYHPEKQDATNSQHPESFGCRQWIYRMTRYPISARDVCRAGF